MFSNLKTKICLHEVLAGFVLVFKFPSETIFLEFYFTTSTYSNAHLGMQNGRESRSQYYEIILFPVKSRPNSKGLFVTDSLIILFQSQTFVKTLLIEHHIYIRIGLRKDLIFQLVL